MTDTIRLERKDDDGVALLTLDRPHALKALNAVNAVNAVNAAMMTELTTVATELDRDPAIGAIVLTGSDRAFAAGADIKEDAAAQLQRRLRHRLVRRLGRPHPGPSAPR